MSWVPGFHHRTDGQLNYDPDLRLIHLHRMDYELCRARHRLAPGPCLERAGSRAGLGVSNRTAEEGDFERWFYEDSGFEDDGVHIAVERIPESFRGLF